jgi:hypothetical protein
MMLLYLSYAKHFLLSSIHRLHGQFIDRYRLIALYIHEQLVIVMIDMNK